MIRPAFVVLAASTPTARASTIYMDSEQTLGIMIELLHSDLPKE